MNGNLEQAMSEAILESLEKANVAGAGTEIREKEIANAVALCKTLNDKVKAELESEGLEEKLDNEKELKNLEIKQSRNEMWVRVATAAAQIVVPLVFYGCWTTRMMRFEELGHLPTSPVFKHLIGKIHPKG